MMETKGSVHINGRRFRALANAIGGVFSKMKRIYTYLFDDSERVIEFSCGMEIPLSYIFSEVKVNFVFDTSA